MASNDEESEDLSEEDAEPVMNQGVMATCFPSGSKIIFNSLPNRLRRVDPTNFQNIHKKAPVSKDKKGSLGKGRKNSKSHIIPPKLSKNSPKNPKTYKKQTKNVEPPKLLFLRNSKNTFL